MASLTTMDEAIGAVLDLLEHLHLTENTIVLFLSDNGGSGTADNGPLRGRKGQLFEGGIRVPCIVRWPGIVPPGTINDEFLTSLEIFPTLCAAAGLSPPAGIALDGFDMTGVLSGREHSPRTAMFWKRRGYRAARVDHWKWVDSGNEIGLFNLDSDIGEQRDLSLDQPHVLQRIEARFAAWEADMEHAEPRGPFRDY
jgi:arylsulfatase A-like enzyme